MPGPTRGLTSGKKCFDAIPANKHSSDKHRFDTVPAGEHAIDTTHITKDTSGTVRHVLGYTTVPR
jgi:hypothetical protein